MTQQRSFTLIGNFTDNITDNLNKINRTLNSISSNRRGGFSGLTQAIGKVNSANKHLRDGMNDTIKTLREQLSVIGQLVRGLQQYRSELGRLTSANKAVDKSAKDMAASQEAAWNKASAALERYNRNYRNLHNFQHGGGNRGGGTGGGFGGGRGFGDRGRRGPRGPLEFAKDFLITQAIVMGFYKGVQILQNGMNAIFKAFAERTRDQLEDIASAGGIFSAGKFGGAKGLPATFQGAMDMQDDLNKQMAAIASALPGTTQDYVMNARRMTDTLAQVFSKDIKEFEKLAQKISGDTQAAGSKAFEIINVEVAKATTLLEKLNPTRTTVPMTQIVEDMMKSETISARGLRRYVSFRRATTLEAALERNMKELNAAGPGTAKRIGAILKVLKEAVPPELITAMTTSVSGVMEGFKSAVTDPDVGIFGLSRMLNIKMRVFNKETGEAMKKGGKELRDTMNFFKIFADIFGNLGNLLNSAVLPGLMAIYSPLEGVAGSLENLREYSFKIFERQQSITSYYSKLADKYGMSTGIFKSGEKGGLGVILEILSSYNLITREKFNRYVEMMDKKGSEAQINARMTEIYKDVIPAFLKSPFISQIFEVIGFTLGKAMVALADLLGVISGANAPRADAFSKAFTKAGGVDAIRRILLSIATLLGRLLMGATNAYIASLKETIFGSGFDLGAKMGTVLFLLLPALFVPGIRNFVFALFRGVARGLFGRGAMRAAAGAAEGAAGGGLASGAGISPFWITPRMQATRRLLRMKAASGSGFLGTLGKGVTATGEGFGKVKGFIGKGVAALGKSKVGKTARLIPRGVLAAGAIDLGISLATGEKFGKAAAGAIGTVLGGAAGSIFAPALGPIGPIIGSMGGNALANWIYDSLDPSTKGQKKAAEMQLEAAKIRQAQASREFKSGVDIVAAGGGSFKLGTAAEFTKRINDLGLSTVPAVKSFENLYRINETNQSIAAKAGDALNAKIKELRDERGLPAATINKQVKGLQITYDNAKKEAQISLTNLNKQWGKIGSSSMEVILNSFRTMPTYETDKAIAERIRKSPLKPPSPATARTNPLGYSRKQIYPQVGPPVPLRLQAEEKPSKGGWFENLFGWMGLGKAVSSEIKNKPSGSKLAIANTSETIIPAAGGYGVESFSSYLSKTSINTASSFYILLEIKNVLNKSYTTLDNLKRLMNQISFQNGNLLKAIIFAGGMEDYGVIGPFPTHVAYAYGAGNPAFFGSAAQAANWEARMAPSNATIRTITTNSSENMGGSYTLHAPISIHQLPGQDTEELAAMVAMRLSMVIDELRNHG
jgi:hypothetical protein